MWCCRITCQGRKGTNRRVGRSNYTQLGIISSESARGQMGHRSAEQQPQRLMSLVCKSRLSQSAFHKGDNECFKEMFPGKEQKSGARARERAGAPGGPGEGTSSANAVSTRDKVLRIRRPEPQRWHFRAQKTLLEKHSRSPGSASHVALGDESRRLLSAEVEMFAISTPFRRRDDNVIDAPLTRVIDPDERGSWKPQSSLESFSQDG